jgi:integrase
MTVSKRQRGEIETLPSGSLRVRVYAGIDPVTRKRHYLTETIAAGPTAAKEAERARTRFLAQVDEKRNPKTRATLNQLLDRYLEQLDVDVQTKRGYVRKLSLHVRPFLGVISLSKIDVEALESLYSDARKCRKHCRGRNFVEHRKGGDHECTQVCRLHECKGLAESSVRQIHWILSGAFDMAVRWNWISVNAADHARKPDMPKPNPHPPSTEDAARLVNAAWEWDEEWGAFLWVHRALYMRDDRTWHEKDTKAHQHRRIALDPETIQVVQDQVDRLRANARALSLRLADPYLFTASPDARTPLNPDTATQRFGRMAKRLGVRSNLHALRHYSATELISAGVDPRTVAGRLGHGGGGATTLRVYAAWVSEADQRAAKTLSGRMPVRPRKVAAAGE